MMMKYVLCAGVAALMVGHASAAGYADVEANFNAGAFSDADEGWRNNIARRNNECGSYGKNRTKRINVLINRYEQLGEAIASGDETAAIAAARVLSSRINANSRFEDCWGVLVKKADISRDLKKALAKV